MSPITLVEALASVPDPRSRHGRRYPLVPLLCLVTLGLLMGKRTLGSIARLGRNYGPELLLALGFPRGRGPVKSVLSRLLRRIDVDALEAALARWVASRLSPTDASVISIDGKTLRGSRDGEIPGVHLVAAYAPDVQAVLGQLRVDCKTNEHKAALKLLGILPLAGKIVIGDAAFCQRDLAEQVIDQGGDYILFVKDNQPSLQTDIGAGFAYEVAAAGQAAAFSP
jgi:DDE_Tnp_1-associated/Transposase DDE domain